MRSSSDGSPTSSGGSGCSIVTLLLYLFGTGLAAFTVNDGGWLWLVYFYGTRFIAGMGIGGQYAAINSAIDEMMPSKYRGRVDIWINGSYWAGAILGSFASLVFLNAFAPDVGWRLAFLMGPVLALVVIIVGTDAPREPAVAHDPRPHGGGGAGAREDRGDRARDGPGARARRRLAGDSSSFPRSGTATSRSWASSSARTRSGRFSAPR